jgi:hypothetical protein
MVNAIHIRATRTKHGRGRHQWGPNEYAQAAIGALFPDGLPPEVASTRGLKAKLVRDVRERLNENRMYRARRFKRIGRNTILRAAGLMT